MGRKIISVVSQLQSLFCLAMISKCNYSVVVNSAPKADVPFQIDYRPKTGLKAICKGTSPSSAPIFYDT
jgi:hypothetical protein